MSTTTSTCPAATKGNNGRRPVLPFNVQDPTTLQALHEFASAVREEREAEANVFVARSRRSQIEASLFAGQLPSAMCRVRQVEDERSRLFSYLSQVVPGSTLGASECGSGLNQLVVGYNEASHTAFVA
ncbi:hypothetical protein BV22DRAFT_1131316 [Leucogyrophana mollusca]|uniref:Uncharacterized protein n=1 Tax=Leucogyrophana mollusca TaxID=85980 RepID=A0ACB8BAQ6_9AGAM|nr:hypothetical protein BV22DRAFT_1131316 [Leucogyrophana mollusca]